MAEVRVVFHIQDEAGNPIVGALLDAGVWRAATLASGDAETNLTPGHYNIVISALGFAPSTLPADILDPGTITHALHRPGNSTLLTVNGRDFVDGHLQRIVRNGTDQFLAFRQYLDGNLNQLEAALLESHDLGFDTWRVFFQGSIAQNNVLQLSPTEPFYYDHVRPFVDLLNVNGIVPLVTIGVDNQDIKSPISHWVRMGQLLSGSGSIISNFNEWSKNHGDIDPLAIPPPAGVLWSRGSDVSDQPPLRPQGPVLEFHPVRNYTTAMRDAVASPIELYEVQGYHGPLLIDEPGRMGTNAHDTRFTNPIEVWRYSRLLSTLCAGAVMHNFFGQRGQLMDPLTRECAKAWTEGMKLR